MTSGMQELAKARTSYNKFKMKCIVPEGTNGVCGKDPIKSHSIQHNGILSLIAENGIVYCLGETTKGEEFFVYDLKEQGVSQEASIFKCLCKDHDDLLFSDIEKRKFVGEQKQCFQYALKALLHSYWSKCNDTGVVKKYSKENPTIKQILVDQEAYREELERFWEIYETENYQDLVSKVITINRTVNSAVSTSINICRKLDGSLFGEENKKYPLLHISIFPTEENSFLIITTLKENAEYFRKFTEQFMLMSVDAILKRFNIIIPLLADNVMISPRIVDKMTEQEKSDLLTIFRIETMKLYFENGIDINAWAEQVSYHIW